MSENFSVVFESSGIVRIDSLYNQNEWVPVKYALVGPGGRASSQEGGEAGEFVEGDTMLMAGVDYIFTRDSLGSTLTSSEMDFHLEAKAGRAGRGNDGISGNSGSLGCMILSVPVEYKDKVSQERFLGEECA